MSLVPRYLPIRFDCVYGRPYRLSGDAYPLSESNVESWESETVDGLFRVADLHVTRTAAEAFLVSLYVVRGESAFTIFEDVHASFFCPPYHDRFPVFDVLGPVRLRLTARNMTEHGHMFDAIVRLTTIVQDAPTRAPAHVHFVDSSSSSKGLP